MAFRSEFVSCDPKGGEGSAASKVGVKLALAPHHHDNGGAPFRCSSLVEEDTSHPRDVQRRAPVLIFALVRFCLLEIIICMKPETG